MKGITKTKELNESGLFISDLDYDDCFKEKGNPKGYFVMILEPLEGDDKGIIYYEPTDDGFLVEGEAYIITGRKDVIKRRVEEWIKNYNKPDFEFINLSLNPVF